MLHYAPFIDKLIDVPLDDNNQPAFPDSPSYLVAIDKAPGKTTSNSSFIPDTSLQFVWDSVSTGHLKTCAYKYYLSTYLGWTFKIQPVKMAFGIAFHKLKEVWAHLCAHGVHKETALKRVVRCAGLLGERLPEGPNTHTKETLIRAITLYIIHFWDDAAETIILPSGDPAVEVDIRYPFTSINGVDHYIVVHVDELVTFQGGTYFSDVKSTGTYLNKQFFSKFDNDNQMKLYDLSTNVFLDQETSGGIIDGVQVQVNGVNFHRHLLQTSPARREDFMNDLEAWLRTATFYAEQGHYPQNESACTHYGGCQFLPICTKPKVQHEMYLRTYFQQKTWDPVDPRN